MSNLGNKEVLANNIVYYMRQNKKTRKAICSDLKIPYSTFTDWVNGNIYPRIDKIEMLANYFGIEKSALIEEHGKETKKETIVDEIASEFHLSDLSLDRLEYVVKIYLVWAERVGTFDFSDDEIDQIVGFANYILSKRGK